MGAANTLIGLGVIYASQRLLGFGDVLANVSGYAVGLTIGFMLNRHRTFGHTGNVRVAVLRFLAVFAIIKRMWSVERLISQQAPNLPVSVVGPVGGAAVATGADARAKTVGDDGYWVVADDARA